MQSVIHGLVIPETVILELTGNSRDAVLAELAKQIPELRDRPEARSSLLQALRDREELHSTGIGDGVALPHARSALADLVERPVIVFGRSRKGISFRAIDGKHVHLFFLIVTSKVTEHLQILAQISRLVHRGPLPQVLLEAGSVEDVLQAISEAERNL
jgi:mannitol/fructose-specific phosphotransferase system IIA component (Ntr-type)